MSAADVAGSKALVGEWRDKVARLFVERKVHRPIERPRLTVAVIAYRSDPAKLRPCLDAIERACARASAPIERLIADCGGNETSRHLFEKLCDTELVLLPDCTLNEARNAVLAWSEGGLVMLVDDDGILEDDAVAAILRHFDAADILAVRGRIRHNQRRYLTTLANHYDRGEKVVDDDLVVEGHMAVHRDAALAVGGFDEAMFGGEGIAITYRLLRDNPGKRIVYAPDVVMRHDFYHDVRHFVQKSAGFANQHEVLLQTLGHEPGFPEYLRASEKRKHEKRDLRADEWLAKRGLLLARAAIRLWARARRPTKQSSPRRS